MPSVMYFFGPSVAQLVVLFRSDCQCLKSVSIALILVCRRHIKIRFAVEYDTQFIP